MHSAPWTVASEAAIAAALPLARGSYQRNLILGGESLSGSTLRGKAARYSGRYAQSRMRLLGRLQAAGISVSEQRGPRGRRLLVLEVADA